MYVHTDMFTPVSRTPGRTNQSPPLKIPVKYFLYHNRYYRLILFKTSEERGTGRHELNITELPSFFVTLFIISASLVFGDSYSNEYLVSYWLIHTNHFYISCISYMNWLMRHGTDLWIFKDNVNTICKLLQRCYGNLSYFANYTCNIIFEKSLKDKIREIVINKTTLIHQIKHQKR